MCSWAWATRRAATHELQLQLQTRTARGRAAHVWGEVQPCKCRNSAKHHRPQVRFELTHSPAPAPQPRTLKHPPHIFDPTDPPRPPSSSRAFPHPVCSPCVRRTGAAASGRIRPCPTHTGASARRLASRGPAHSAGCGDLPSRTFASAPAKYNLCTPRTPCVCSSGLYRGQTVPHAPQGECGPRGVPWHGSTGRPRRSPRRLV